MADDQHTQHTTHVAWVRAALRDKLELSDDGGTVTITADGLDELARLAVKETISWIVAAGKNGEIEVLDDGEG